MQPYHLHPLAVHFPIAFLVAGFGTQIIAAVPRRRPVLAQAVSWLLWAGVVALWVAVVLGLVAEHTAPHLPPAWEVLHEHRSLGLWSAGLFTALAVVRFLVKERLVRVQLLLWLVAISLLLFTGYRGGQLVFIFGMGVADH